MSTIAIQTPDKAGSGRAHSGFAHESTKNESVEWYTPKEIFDALGVRFDLDPCSPGQGLSFVPADRVYTEADDGLTSPWGDDFVFMNPPYGSNTKVWMKKLADHGNGMALVFARTDNRWFQDFGGSADVVCFIGSRIKFYKGNIVDRADSPGAGSMLVAYGEKAAQAVLNSGLGVCFQPSAMAVAA